MKGEMERGGRGGGRDTGSKLSGGTSLATNKHIRVP